jgi:hypothetical protein
MPPYASITWIRFVSPEVRKGIISVITFLRVTTPLEESAKEKQF